MLNEQISSIIEFYAERFRDMNLNEACERLYNIIELKEDNNIKNNIQNILVDINSNIYFYDTIELTHINMEFYVSQISDDFIFGMDKKILDLLWNADFDGLIYYDIEDVNSHISINNSVRRLSIINDGTLTIFPIDN